ncbi:hypothetical protein BKA80DRAFT_271668 [Phyllosticta citrichinensis]
MTAEDAVATRTNTRSQACCRQISSRPPTNSPNFSPEPATGTVLTSAVAMRVTSPRTSHSLGAYSLDEPALTFGQVSDDTACENIYTCKPDYMGCRPKAKQSTDRKNFLCDCPLVCNESDGHTNFPH